jgi:hypothetical protein
MVCRLSSDSSYWPFYWLHIWTKDAIGIQQYYCLQST